MTEQPAVRVRRVYDEPEADDGKRVLVDRLWPRGVSRERARLDSWSKAVAPSDELRRWFGHRPERFDEFSRRYRAELDEAESAEELEHLRELAGSGPLTLLTATKDLELSHAPLLARLLGGDA